MNSLITLEVREKRKVTIPIYVSESINEKIFEVLAIDDGPSNESLFKILHEQFVYKLGENAGLYLYQVKRDLE